MRTVFNFMAKPKNIYRLLICFVLLSAMLALPLLSRARTTAGSITITNNSGREIRHLYLSPVGSDNWSADQLGGSVISTGASYTLGNVACDGANVQVNAEDQNGCFFSQAVACGDNSSWVIASDATPNCGN